MGMVTMKCSHYHDSVNSIQSPVSKRVVRPRPNMAQVGQPRDVEELRDMLNEAEERKQLWEKYFKSAKMERKANAEAIRNITALRGVIKTLRWTLNMTDKNGISISHPLD